MITTLMRVIIGFKIALVITVVTVIFVYSSEIGDLFTGVGARFDHLIGYGEQG